MLFKKYGIHIVLIISSLVIVMVPLLEKDPDPEKIRRATVAATAFFERIDAGDFEDARKEGAQLLKQRVTLNDWVEKLDKAKSLYGPVIERQQVESNYSTSAQDSPDGEYVMLSYVSDFTRKKALNETVIVMLDGERGWRVAGYFYR